MGIKIIPQYVKNHKSVYLQVATGRLPAGDGVKSTFDAQSETIRKHLKIIYRTRALVPHPFIVHPRISKTVIEETVSAFLKLDHDVESNTLLSNIPMQKVIRANVVDYSNISTIDLKSLSQNH